MQPDTPPNEESSPPIALARVRSLVAHRLGCTPEVLGVAVQWLREPDQFVVLLDYLLIESQAEGVAAEIDAQERARMTELLRCRAKKPVAVGEFGLALQNKAPLLVDLFDSEFTYDTPIDLLLRRRVALFVPFQVSLNVPEELFGRPPLPADSSAGDQRQSSTSATLVLSVFSETVEPFRAVLGAELPRQDSARPTRGLFERELGMIPQPLLDDVANEAIRRAHQAGAELPNLPMIGSAELSRDEIVLGEGVTDDRFQMLRKKLQALLPRYGIALFGLSMCSTAKDAFSASHGPAVSKEEPSETWSRPLLAFDSVAIVDRNWHANRDAAYHDTFRMAEHAAYEELLLQRRADSAPVAILDPAGCSLPSSLPAADAAGFVEVHIPLPSNATTPSQAQPRPAGRLLIFGVRIGSEAQVRSAQGLLRDLASRLGALVAAVEFACDGIIKHNGRHVAEDVIRFVLTLLLSEGHARQEGPMAPPQDVDRWLQLALRTPRWFGGSRVVDASGFRDLPQMIAVVRSHLDPAYTAVWRTGEVLRLGSVPARPTTVADPGGIGEHALRVDAETDDRKRALASARVTDRFRVILAKLIESSGIISRGVSWFKWRASDTKIVHLTDGREGPPLDLGARWPRSIEEIHPGQPSDIVLRVALDDVGVQLLVAPISGFSPEHFANDAVLPFWSGDEVKDYPANCWFALWKFRRIQHGAVPEFMTCRPALVANVLRHASWQRRDEQPAKWIRPHGLAQELADHAPQFPIVLGAAFHNGGRFHRSYCGLFNRSQFPNLPSRFVSDSMFAPENSGPPSAESGARRTDAALWDLVDLPFWKRVFPSIRDNKDQFRRAGRATLAMGTILLQPELFRTACVQPSRLIPAMLRVGGLKRYTSLAFVISRHAADSVIVVEAYVSRNPMGSIGTLLPEAGDPRRGEVPVDLVLAIEEALSEAGFLERDARRAPPTGASANVAQATGAKELETLESTNDASSRHPFVPRHPEPERPSWLVPARYLSRRTIDLHTRRLLRSAIKRFVECRLSQNEFNTAFHEGCSSVCPPGTRFEHSAKEWIWEATAYVARADLNRRLRELLDTVWRKTGIGEAVTDAIIAKMHLQETLANVPAQKEKEWKDLLDGTVVPSVPRVHETSSDDAAKLLLLLHRFLRVAERSELKWDDVSPRRLHQWYLFLKPRFETKASSSGDWTFPDPDCVLAAAWGSVYSSSDSPPSPTER